MHNIGDTVRVKEPFKQYFPNEYLITEIVLNEDGSTVYILGECGGFDAIFLESVT